MSRLSPPPADAMLLQSGMMPRHAEDKRMPMISASKSAFALAASIAVTAMACSTAQPPAAFKSVGRGAPVTPEIPAHTWVVPDNIEPFPPAEIKGYPEQHWLVGPFDLAEQGGPAGFLGAAR